MKPALLRYGRVGSALGLMLAIVAIAGCGDNDLSMSILEMEALTLPSCMATAVAGTGMVGRDRGLLDVALVQSTGYIGVPVIRNELPANTASGVEINSIQLIGADVTLQLPAAAAGAVPESERTFFYAAAAGRIDPAGLAPMYVEALPAIVAKQLAGSIPKGGLLTVTVKIQPVGIRAGDQVIGGPVFYPIDLCSNCIISNQQCPLPAGTSAAVGGCFAQQDDPLVCCTDTKGQIFCGASAPVSM